MSTRQQAPLPRALSRSRRQSDQWRSRHRKHDRLPKELWRQAVALAREHGINKTSRILGLKYYSLKKHLDQAGADELIPAKAEPDFIELVPGVMSSGSIECTIEWADSSGTMVWIHLKGAGLLDPASLASMIALLKYGSGLPFNRLERLEGSLGIPLPATTQWEIIEQSAAAIEPVFEEMIRQAAQGRVLHNDDTTMKVLDLAKARRHVNPYRFLREDSE